MRIFRHRLHHTGDGKIHNSLEIQCLAHRVFLAEIAAGRLPGNHDGLGLGKRRPGIPGYHLDIEHLQCGGVGKIEILLAERPVCFLITDGTGLLPHVVKPDGFLNHVRILRLERRTCPEGNRGVGLLLGGGDGGLYQPDDTVFFGEKLIVTQLMNDIERRQYAASYADGKAQ